MPDLVIIDLAKKGTPNVHLLLPPTESQLIIQMGSSNPQTSSDFTGDEFSAAVSVDGTAIAPLTTETEYDDDLEKTIVTITFPASGIPLKGRFGLYWLTAAGGSAWPLNGSYERQFLIPATIPEP